MNESNFFNLMLVGIVVIAAVTIIAVNVLTPLVIKLSEHAYGERAQDNTSTGDAATPNPQDSHERATRIVMGLIGLCMVGWLLFAVVGMTVGQATR